MESEKVDMNKQCVCVCERERERESLTNIDGRMVDKETNKLTHEYTYR